MTDKKPTRDDEYEVAVNPDDLVLGFIAALGVCVRAPQGTTTGVSRAEVGAPLTAVSPLGFRSRAGSVPGVGSYKLHGAGCRFELESGEAVDFDWDQGGRPVFDVWRVRDYARSVGSPGVDPDHLNEVLVVLCERGVLGRAERVGFFVSDLATRSG